jgi:hypothetical protein
VCADRVGGGLYAAVQRHVDPLDILAVCQVCVWLAGNECAREQDMSIKLSGDLTGLPETGCQTVRRQEKDCLVAATVARLTGGGGDREVGPVAAVISRSAGGSGDRHQQVR